jgi:hypothetical protein
VSAVSSWGVSAVGYLAAYYQQATDIRKLPDSSYCLLLGTLHVHLTWCLGEFPYICPLDVWHWLVVIADHLLRILNPWIIHWPQRWSARIAHRPFAFRVVVDVVSPALYSGSPGFNFRPGTGYLHGGFFLWQMSGEYLKLGVWPHPSLSSPMHH